MSLLSSVQASLHRFSLRVGAKKRARCVVRRSFGVTLWVFASTRILSVVAAVLLPRHSIAAEPASTNLLSLQSVLSEVFSNNPSLKAARANWEAMRERVPQARAWEDARAGFDATLDRF